MMKLVNKARENNEILKYIKGEPKFYQELNYDEFIEQLDQIFSHNKWTNSAPTIILDSLLTFEELEFVTLSPEQVRSVKVLEEIVTDQMKNPTIPNFPNYNEFVLHESFDSQDENLKQF